MALIAYNDMLPVRHPETDETVHLISLGTRHAKGGAMRNPNELGRTVPGISSGTRKGTTASAGCSIQIIRYPTEPAAVCVQPAPSDLRPSPMKRAASGISRASTPSAGHRI